MTASYELWLTNDSGLRLAPLSQVISLDASRVVNGIAYCNLQMPLSFDPDLIAPDRMIQIWRQPTGGALSLWRVYFVRRWKFSTRGSDQIVEFGGPDVNDLLRRRIVAAYSGAAQADKTDNADDMMKEVVTESIADGVDPTPDAGTRVWSNLSIDADLSLGPSITKAFAFDKLLTTAGQGVLATLGNAAREAGTEVFFDIVPNVVAANSITFQFRTYTGQPGQDVSDRVTFDQQSGNMREPALEYDYTDEENYIYAGGQGEGELRTIQQVYDSDRYSASIWARSEGFADARNQTTDNGVREAARDRLTAGRPRIRFGATPVDTEGTRYGIDWDFGYKVGAKYLNRQFNTIIRAVTISLNDNGEETVQARLDYEAAL
jgi:hypothetical protein